MKKNNKAPSDKLLVINENSSFFYKVEDGKVSLRENTDLILEKNNTHSIVFIEDNKYNLISFEEDNNVLESADIKDIIETHLVKETSVSEEEEFEYYYVKEPSPFDIRKTNLIVYAVPKNSIEEDYGEIAKNINYIDYITSPVFLPSVLYKKDILEKDKTDVYIFFGMDSSFISIYKEGLYIYSKELPITLDDIYIKLSNKLKHKISIEDFKTLLTERGFNIDSYEGEDMDILDLLINDIFHEIFNTINKIIMSGRRLLKIDNLDRVFIGTEIGSIPEMEDYATEKLSGVKTLDMSILDKVDLGFDKEEKNISPLVQYSKLLFSMESDAVNIPNLTHFKRPLPLRKRPTFIPLAIIGSSLAFYALFLLGQTFYISSLKQDISDLNQQNSSFKVSLAETEAYRKKILGEKKKLIDKEQALQTELNSKIQKLKKLKIQINSNEAVAGYIVNIYKKLVKNKLTLKNFVLNGSNITLDIETDKHINIGNFINDMLNTNLYIVKVSNVQYVQKEGVFKTSIKLKRIN